MPMFPRPLHRAYQVRWKLLDKALKEKKKEKIKKNKKKPTKEGGKITEYRFSTLVIIIHVKGISLLRSYNCITEI